MQHPQPIETHATPTPTFNFFHLNRRYLVKTQKQLFALTAGALIAAGAVTQTADAELLVYEGFQYNAAGDSLQGNPDGDAGEVDATGLTGTWNDAASNTEMFLKPGSLNFSSLPTAGNHIGYESNINNDIFHRSLDANAQSGIGGADTLYFSFLFEKLQNNFGADHEGFALMNDVLASSRFDSGNVGAAGVHGFAVANVDGLNGSDLQAVAYDGTTGTRVVGENGLPITVVNGGSNTDTSNQEVNLIIGEISFNTGTNGADVFNLWNAADDGSLDAGDLTLIDTIEADVDESLLNTLNLTRQVNVNYDEVRVGTTLSDVIVPEPASLALLGIGGLMMLRRRK